MVRYAAVALAVLGLTWSSMPSGGSGPIAEPPERPADQTFLTFPEWFLVYSPDEYARFIADRPPSHFPFLGHVGQFWGAYAGVREALAELPFNPGYHLMIGVIGLSTTVEYSVKAVWEALIGRVTELAAGDDTAEDAFAVTVATEYVDFIRELPWYEFDYAARVERLMTDVPMGGAGPLRKWERRYALLTEWIAKTAYGWMTKQAAGATYAKPSLFTRVLVDRPVPPFVNVVRDAAGVALDLPRYQAFTAAAQHVAKAGANFIAIAGNTGLIATSVLVPDGWRAPDGVELTTVFEQPILTVPGRKRVVLATPVARLSAMLRSYEEGAAVVVEHVYDY